jgi:gamma-glutamyltranspeptidase / glutathione hydrolase
MEFERYQFPGRRSNVLARNGLVATSQPLAAQAGLEILRQGGNAVDAAVATVATLCVVEPTSTGIGGDAFALIWMAGEGRLYGLNASGPAPAALTAEWIRAQEHETMPRRGAVTVTVPGSLRGWEAALERFGTMGLDRLLRPAMSYARDGFPVSQRIAGGWGRSTGLLSGHPDSRRVWLPGGRAPGAGQIFTNLEFTATLETLAEEGYEAFYQGDIGRQIVESVQAGGGRLTMDDLAAYRAEWVEPISVEYRQGYTFHEIPPNGQGLTALLALNIVRGFDVAAMGYGSPDAWHAEIEAVKLAFADAAAYIGDPGQVEVPVEGLLSETYSEQRRAMIRADRALLPVPGQPPQGSDTVYLSAADGQGNMVSWIQSLYMGFGSGLTAGQTGVQLQNRGANFVLEEGHPNQVGPGRRPYHTIIPGFITRDGQAWCSFGVMGGFMQPQGHLQVGLNLIDYGMDPQTALDAPRFRWLEGRRVALEGAVPGDVRRELVRRGHELPSPEQAAGVGYGGGQVIVRDPERGVLIGGSEPRSDGAAAGW